MTSPAGWTVNVIGSYNYALVALSVLIAMVASYAALDLAARVTAATGWTRAVWLLGGDRHLVDALHRHAGVRPPDSHGLPLADRSALIRCRHCRVGHRPVRGEPTKDGRGTSRRRKRADGGGDREHALHRHG